MSALQHSQARASPKDVMQKPKSENESGLKAAKYGKSPAPAHNDEGAPLLADPSADGSDLEAVVGNKEESSTWRSRVGLSAHNGFTWVIENVVTVVLACLLAACTVATCLYGVMHHHAPSAETSPVCTTPGCVLAASELLHNLSPRYRDIDPCIDFRAFVCEGWDLRHDLREDQSDLFTGTIMNEQSQVLLRHVLESPSPGEPLEDDKNGRIEKVNFHKLQDAYRACMDESAIQAQASSPLIDILRNLQKILPALPPQKSRTAFSNLLTWEQKKSFLDEEHPLWRAIVFVMGINSEALISAYINADDKDPDNTVLFLAPPNQPGLPSKEYYSDNQMLESYSKTIGQVFEALLNEAEPEPGLLEYWQTYSRNGSTFSTANAKLVRTLVEFEKKLAKASPDNEDANDVTKYYNQRSLEETQAILPQVSFRDLISSVAPRFVPTKIIVASPSYLKAVSEILPYTSRETLQLYFLWKLIQSYGPSLKSEAIKPLIRFNNQLLGKDPDATEERWRTCVKHVDHGLSWILSQVYIENAFSEQAKNFGDLIVSDIKSQFIKKLGTAEWMSPDVRQLGIQKVHNIEQKIGYPTKSPNIRDPTALQDYYSHTIISNASFFNNSLSIARAAVARNWAKAGKPTDRDEWGMTASTVNAYYNPAGNEIVFPAGIMQSPVFYDPSIPQYLSYGAFGSVSGHELSHAFDSTGRHYDQRGNYTSWWDNNTIEAFQDKAECFVDQYHHFTVSGPHGESLRVNGRLTLGENIADAGGLSASFLAWKERDDVRPADLLPGLEDFSKEQLFFISYSNWWCGKTRKEQAVNRIYTDPHSPKWARILGTMANSREFRESFACPRKEPTCEMW